MEQTAEVGISKQEVLLSEGRERLSLAQEEEKKHLLLNQPSRLVAATPRAIYAGRLVDGNAWQVDILHDSPDNR